MIVLALLLAGYAPAQELLPGPYRPGEESVWAIEIDGKRIGHCASRYEGEVGLGALRAHHFRDQVLLEIATPSGPLEQRFTVELWAADDGHPLRFDFRARIGDAPSAVDCVFLPDGQAQCVVRQGPNPKTLVLNPPDGAYLLANNFVSQLELALVCAGDGPLTFFSGNSLQAFPYTQKPVAAAASERVYDDSLGERLRLSADGRLASLEVAAQKLTMRRVEEVVEPFTIELPHSVQAADLEREEVRIDDGDVSLAGTITRKKGASGKLPGVFFLSGSGPQDRDGFSSGLDLGTHEILDRLTREGFLVLRVDDRGVGESKGPLTDLDFGDLVEDGRRALRFLRARPDVDGERVALLGHSEGGLSAPVLAAEEAAAAVVLLAAPGRTLEVLLREQLLAGKQLAGASAEELTAYDAQIDAFLDALAKGSEPTGAPPELAAFLPARAWLLSHLGRDPLPFYQKVRCPILLLQGGRDVQVSAERDAPRIVATLDEAHHADHELHVFPTLDHLFKQASDPPSELDYLRSRPVDAAFLDVLVAWLKQRLMR